MDVVAKQLRWFLGFLFFFFLVPSARIIKPVKEGCPISRFDFYDSITDVQSRLQGSHGYISSCFDEQLSRINIIGV